MKRKMAAGALAILCIMTLTACGSNVKYGKPDIDISAMAEDEVKYKQISDIIYEPEKYEGQIIKVHGKAYTHHEEGINITDHMCLTTWADEEEPEGLCYRLADGKYPEDGKMITVTGMMTTYEKEVNGILVQISELREAEIEQ